MNTKILSKLKKANKIYEKYGINKVYLTGSYSRGEETKNSDIDLYFKTNIFLDIYKYMNLKFELESELGKKVDLITDDNLKPGIKQYILKDLVLIR